MADRPVDAAQQELERAREALADARVLLEGQGSDVGVLNRLYYAAFHGAQAALYARDKIRHRTVTYANSSVNTSS